MKVTVPANLAGKTILLEFEGVDEEAWVYFNGQFPGERTATSTRKSVDDFWDKPFALKVPAEAVRYGAENVLAVRVHDSTAMGGIFRPVRLLVEQ